MNRLCTIWVAGALAVSAGPSATAADMAAAEQHVQQARLLAGDQFQKSLFLCDSNGLNTVVLAAVKGSEHWLQPTKVFDDFYYVGSEFVGAWILRTSAGLILFDSTGSTADARDHLVPGLQALGLDPTSIRYVIVTHGHWDHYGGAKYLQDT